MVRCTGAVQWILCINDNEARSDLYGAHVCKLWMIHLFTSRVNSDVIFEMCNRVTYSFVSTVICNNRGVTILYYDTSVKFRLIADFFLLLVKN